MSIRTVEIVTNSGLQGIAIPEGMEIDDNKVYLKRVGNSLFVIPFHEPWRNMIDSVDIFTEDFMESRHQPDGQDREPFD